MCSSGEFNGPEQRRGKGRRVADQITRVVVDGVENGAQADVERMLALLTRVCTIMEHTGLWMRRVGWLIAIGLVTGLIWIGAWWFKVDTHVTTDELRMNNTDAVLHELSTTQARTLGVIEGIKDRLERLEEREP